MPPPTPPGVPENVDPETLEPLPVERLLHGLSAQLIGDFTSAAEQDQSLKQPFLEQLVPALSVGDFPEKELLTSSSWRMSDLAGAASIVANWGMETSVAVDLLPVLQETTNKGRLADGLVGLFYKACEGNQSWADASYATRGTTSATC